MLRARCAEGRLLSRRGLDFVAVGLEALALLLQVEAQVLEDNDRAGRRAGARGLDLRTHAVGQELDRLLHDLAQLLGDGLEGLLRVGVALLVELEGPAEVAHQDDGLCALRERHLDARDRLRVVKL